MQYVAWILVAADFFVSVSAGSEACPRRTVTNLASVPELSTPQYPGYSNSYLAFNYCTWMIGPSAPDQIIAMEVVSANLPKWSNWTGCPVASFSAYDGPTNNSPHLTTACGTDIPLITTTGRYMFLEYNIADNHTFGGLGFTVIFFELPASSFIQPRKPVEQPTSSTIQPKNPVEPPASSTIQPKNPVEPPASSTIQPKNPVEPPASSTIQPKKPVDPIAAASLFNDTSGGTSPTLIIIIACSVLGFVLLLILASVCGHKAYTNKLREGVSRLSANPENKIVPDSRHRSFPVLPTKRVLDEEAPSSDTAHPGTSTVDPKDS